MDQRFPGVSRQEQEGLGQIDLEKMDRMGGHRGCRGCRGLTFDHDHYVPPQADGTEIIDYMAPFNLRIRRPLWASMLTLGGAALGGAFALWLGLKIGGVL